VPTSYSSLRSYWFALSSFTGLYLNPVSYALFAAALAQGTLISVITTRYSNIDLKRQIISLVKQVAYTKGDHRRYCHVIECGCRRGFGYMTRFIAHFDTARDYNLQFIITHSTINSHVFTAVAWKRPPRVDVPLPADSQNVPDLRCQLPTATAHHNWTPAVF
jgi:hypothetical protein